tara:strand:+ start:1027 stop:1308 length:282 start_codon:yes stop_codon:yes gene_type:complete
MSYNYALRPGTHQMITLANGNSTPSAAFGTQTEYVRICSDADVHIIFGAAPVATANSIFISAEEFEIFKVSPGEKVACIGANTNKISITEMGA